jgi:O-antigen/teichoic acid export membrane protein
MATSSFGARVRSSLLWSALDKWGTRIMTLVVLVVLGRLLQPEDFGVVALASAYLAFVNILVDGGFGKALVQRKSLSARDASTAFWANMALSLVFLVLTLVLARWAEDAFDSEGLGAVLVVLSPVLVLQAAASAAAALLERAMDFRSLALRRTVGTFVGGGAAIAAALSGWGVWSLVLQQLVTAGLSLIVLWWRTPLRPWQGISWRSLRELWGVGIYISGTSLVGAVNSQADRVIVALFFGPAALGYYYMAMRIVSVVVEMFTSMFSTVSLTVFSKHQSDMPSLRTWLRKLTDSSSSITIPVFTVLVSVAPFAVSLALGPQWFESVPVLQILCMLGAINSLLIFDRSVLIAVGRSGQAFGISVVQAALGLLLIWLAGPHGLLAVAAAVVVRQILVIPIRFTLVGRATGATAGDYFGGWLRVLASCAVALVAWLGTMYLVNTLSIPSEPLETLIGILAIAVYLLASIMLFARPQFSMLLSSVRAIGRKAA